MRGAVSAAPRRPGGAFPRHRDDARGAHWLPPPAVTRAAPSRCGPPGDWLAAPGRPAPRAVPGEASARRLADGAAAPPPPRPAPRRAGTSESRPSRRTVVRASPRRDEPRFPMETKRAEIPSSVLDDLCR